MKLLTLICMMLFTIHAAAQPAGRKTFKKTQYYRINKECGYERYWYEVQLPDKAVAAKINNSIRSIFKSNTYEGYTERPCDSDYHFYYNCEITSFNKNIYSFFISFRYCDQEFNCSHHRFDSHETYNYDIATGKLLTIDDIVIQGKKKAFDSMIVHRLAFDSQLPDSSLYITGMANNLISNRFCYRKNKLFFTFDSGLTFFDMTFTSDELNGYIKPEYIE